MGLEERIRSLSDWGEKMTLVGSLELEQVFAKAENKNRWFTHANCANAITSILPWLTIPTLRAWSSRYSISYKPTNKTVGIVMAGNIPIVGFHDLMCVLISGHRAKIKLSAQDDVLLPYMTSLLSLIASDFNKMVSYEDRLTGVDALIATGSDNSSRYFEYYFRNIPSIIRKNRTSVGVISGSEEPAALHELGRDVFNYFGLGCRNVSKLFVPENFDIDCLASSFVGFQNIINHNKYGNNYDYQKAIRLISGKKFLDGGFFLMEESKEVVSAISVLYYERYQNTNHLADLLKAHEEKTQCVVSANGWVNGSISFGTAQEPAIDDYADGVDTMKFLEGPY